MELLAVLNGEIAAVIRQLPTGGLTLRYDDDWRSRSDAFPVSLSMPLARREHPDSAVRPYLEGLLPDNRHALERWGREFHVSPRNPFGLLTHIGEDCAGAVQFVVPERLFEIRASGKQAIEWLSEHDVAERLREAVMGGGTGRLAEDRGRFSLAGAQPKTALYFDAGRRGIPFGPVPTTHILKPPTQTDLDGFVVNEHFCLKLAGRLGLRAAGSSVQVFDGERAIVVERYDRAQTENGQFYRLHQKDMCQALGISPSIKYEIDTPPA